MGISKLDNFGVQQIRLGVMGIVTPMKKAGQNINFAISLYGYFVAPITEEMQSVSKNLTLGNHTFNVIAFFSGVIELTFPDEKGEYVFFSSELSLPARAAKVTDLVVTSLSAYSASLEFSILDGAVFAGRTVGVFPLFELSRDILLVTSSTFTLMNYSIYETPDEASNETEKKKRMIKIVNSVRVIVATTLAIGLIAAGQTAAPVIITSKIIALSIDALDLSGKFVVWVQWRRLNQSVAAQSNDQFILSRFVCGPFDDIEGFVPVDPMQDHDLHHVDIESIL